MAWTEKRAKGYRGAYRDADNKVKKTETVTSKRAALKLAQDAEAQIRAGTWHDPSAGQLTFAQYFNEHWFPNRVREKTTKSSYRSNYNGGLRDYFGDMEVRKITTPVVQRWVTKMVQDGKTPGTIKAYHRTLSTCLGGKTGSSAVRDGLISKSPCDGVDLPRVAPRKINSYSVDEVDRLMAAIPVWWHPLIMLAADSGLRWGELMGLNVADAMGGRVVVNKTIIQLTKAETGTGTPFAWKAWPKGMDERDIAISPEVSAMVEAMVKERKLFPADRLFSMPRRGAVDRTKEWPAGRPVSRSYMRQNVWLPAHKVTELTPLHFHDLRGSHITWLLGGHADIVTVMKRVGHEQMSTTQAYVRSMRDADERALNALAEMRKAHRHG